MSQIHILDGQEDIILDYITAKNIISDNHKKSLEDTLETYDFITFADKRFSQYLEKRNRIIIPDEDESLREFIIFEGQRYRDSEGHKVQIFANASYLELKKASIIYPNTFKGTASQHAGRSLNDTGWQVGIVEVSGDITITINEHTNPYENLKRIAKEFNAELRFRIEHDGSKVIGRYVDLLERVGDWQGREVTFGKDLDSIRRVEKQDIVTALLGLGPEKDDGTRLEVLVEDEEALQRWGRIDGNGKLKHLIEVYEIQSERTEMTEQEARQYTRTALDKRINTQVTYETTIVDLEEVVGHENKKIRFGDTIRIKDVKFNPPLYLEARVFEINRSIKSKAKKDIKLGDYIEYTEEEVNTLWEQLKKEIQDRLARLVIATVVSSGGDVFKNGVGTTQLTAKTFVNGHEVDEDGARYDYQWIKFDKDSKQVDGFIETGKTLNVTANDIDEKATYRVLVAYGLDVVTTVDYTLTHLFDGAEGKPGKDGKDGKDGHTPVKGADYFDGVDGQDGQSSYLWIRYSQNADGNPMTTEPLNAKYIGVATTQTPNAPNHYNSYTWSLVKGTDGVPGETGDDGKTSYLHIKYSNDGGKTFTGNNGEAVGDWIGTYVDFTQADSNDVNKYTWNKVKGEKGEPGERGLQGLQGKDGSQGIPGKPGADGRTSYTHIAYADTASGGGFSQNPSNKKYVGMYVDFTEQDSTDPSKYKWSLIKGADGTQGVPGKPGADGKTPYFHTAWANNATGTSGFSTTVSANKLYIGTYTDFVQADSNDPSKYNWTKIKGDKGDKGDTGAQGIPGKPGADGKTYYTWVKYANTPTSGMSDNPSGKDYIGLAYNQESPTMSTKYSDYTWSLFKGPQGVQGKPGADGDPTYTWVKYADDDKGNGMSDSPDNKKYIGLAFNKKTAKESNNASDYSWSLMPQNIGIGGRNIINYSKGNTLEDWVAWGNTSLSIYTSASFADGREWIWSTKGEGNQVGVHTPPFDLKANKKYIISFTIRSLSNSGYQLNYLYLRSGQGTLATVKSLPQINMNDDKFEGNIAGDGLRVWFEFEHNEDVKNARILLAIRDRPDNAGFVLREIQIEQSDVLNPWKPSPEDVDKSIQEVKATANGKNSIFRQNTEPSTAGRKVGDVWFKTNDDNKMHTFDGTKWNPATFGEQAITAESITALHIKSLNGLNVNDQFTVDQNGNVEFGGHLKGASGEFGDVKVTDGDFNLEDSISGMQYGVSMKRNLIRDHSFEMLKPNYTASPDSIKYNWEPLDKSTTAWKSPWLPVLNPMVSVQTGPSKATEQPIFGDQAAVVKIANYYRQYIGGTLGAGTTYTLSAHFKRQKGQASGSPSLQIWHVDEGTNRKSMLLNINFPAVPSNYDVVRHSATFTTPTSFNFWEGLELIVSASNNNWVQVDGVQLVEGDRASVYDPETSIWDITKNEYDIDFRQNVLWMGERYPTETQTVTPSKGIHDCKNGWILRWQGYNPGTGGTETHFQYTYIPKMGIVHANGKGNRVILARQEDTLMYKYLYIYHDRIVGHAQNGAGGNRDMALTGVFEW